MVHREQGMTLLEVVLAVLVLSLGLFAAAASQIRAVQAGEGARRDAQAVQLAHLLFERVRASGTLEPEALHGWRALTGSLLDERGEGRAVVAGEWLQLEIRWHDPRSSEAQFIALQGRVLP
ncbi:prepilin-type N-terminal cleavage/methylation domain-containing protein [Pseudomonas sp. NY15374]|uniref:prepilin-type N-terminal cleavage/methylation domain-containing protein n=1 Tax=Pseudomonas sp. NY15374 TaxID=3400357 RepID=UPI003A8AF7C4